MIVHITPGTNFGIITKVCIIVLLCLPIFNQYNIGETGIRLSSLLTVLSLVFIFIAHFLGNLRFKKYRRDALYPIAFLAIWQIFITFLYILAHLYYIPIGYALFFPCIMIAILYLLRNLNTGIYIIRAYITISNIIILFLIVQILLYYIFGFFIPGKLPLLTLTNEYSRIPIFGVNTIGNISFSSVFSERAKFVQYIMPYLCLCLFGYKDVIKKSLTKASFVTIVMCLTISGNAVVICAIIWFIYFYLSSGKSIVRKLLYVVGGLILIYFAFMILNNIPAFNDLFSRLFSDRSGSSYYYSKADYRIYRGLEYFINLPFSRQVFGIGFGALTSYANTYGIRSQFDVVEVYSEYLSAIFQVMIYTGFIGMTFYVKYFIGLYKQSSKCFKAVTISFLALSISSSIYFDYMWLIYSMLILCNISFNNARNIDV